jgi:enolase
MNCSAPTITSLHAREVLDCRGLPTVQVDLGVDGGHLGVADVPAGRSTGANEASERRDGGTRFGGYGVLGAVGTINGELSDALQGTAPGSQRDLDAKLCAIDGTPDKSRLGANAILGVSLAYARASAASAGRPLYRALNADAHVLPVPLVNLINGGRHASNDLDIQEVIVIPVGAASILEALQWSTEIQLSLAEVLLDRFGKVALNTGDEGGFAPPVSRVEEALELLHDAVNASGYAAGCRYGLDAAATHWYDAEAGRYRLAGETFDRAGLIARYQQLIADYGLVTIEDPLFEEDFEGFAELTATSGIQIVGDDLLVTNPARVRRAVEAGAANSLLWKVNQIGTLSEALDAAGVAQRAGWTVVVSERSGETEDPIIADLAVALGAAQIKTGAPTRGERTAKYNRLLRIEEELGATAVYGDGRLQLEGAAVEGLPTA